jgi:putative membrane protein
MRMLTSKYFVIVHFFSLMIVINSCGKRVSSEESKAIAEDKNDEKFDTKTGGKDAQFVVDEVSSAYEEIGIAELAEHHAIDQEVKDVALILKSEHNALLTDLQNYASSKAISIPTEATDKAQKGAVNLSNEDGFDKKWCAEVRDMHKKTIDEFESASGYISDPDLKDWINKMLPSLRAHHDKIMAIHERLK